MKQYISEIIQWFIACAIAVLLINMLLYGYHRPAGWIDRTDSSTSAIWRPHSYVLMGTEGRGKHKVDSNGYLNKELPKEDGYSLVVGSSFTAGKEVEAGKRYTDILNDKIVKNQASLAVYNCSKDGNFFPDIVNDFYAITHEFGDAGTIIIEINNTDFSADVLENACKQHGFNVNLTGENIIKNLSFINQIKLYIKEALPIYTVVKSQVIALTSKSDVDGENLKNIKYDDSAKEEALNEALKLIRNQFKRDIIIIYHPSVSIAESGELVIKQQDTKVMFAELCKKNSIVFIDTEDAFSEAYIKNYEVPYGFPDTTMGSGHFNESGHRIMAEELYRVLLE